MIKRVAELFRHRLFKVISGILAFAISGALIISIVESKGPFSSLGKSFWYVLVTITTVGYGDMVPDTTAGKVIGGLIIFIGVALLSTFTATVSTIFITRQLKEGRGLEQIKLKNHLIICGWNYNAEQILTGLKKQLNRAGSVVLINQLAEEAVSEIINHFAALKIKFVHGDFTKESTLNRANIKSAQAVIIVPDTSAGLGSKSDERTILASLSIKGINQKIKVYAHILDRENLSHIRKAKADDVLISDSYSGYLLAAHILSPGVPQLINHLFSDDGHYQFDRMEMPAAYQGKTYGELKNFLTSEKNSILIGLGEEHEQVELANILSDDYSYLDQFIMRKFEEAGRGFNQESKIKITINPADDTLLEIKNFLLIIKNGEQ
jgi:voltage-gated potassium channel